jgi:hypothetical protein
MLMNQSPLRTRTTWIIAALALAVAGSALAGPGKRPAQTQTFNVAPDAKIVVGDNKKAGLADLKPGDHVAIAHSEDNGALVARRIRDLGPNPEKPQRPEGTNSVPQKPPGNPDSNLKHARGMVENVDVPARTLTITTKRPVPPGNPPAAKP